MASNRLSMRSRLIRYLDDLGRKGLFRLAKLDPNDPSKEGTVRDPRDIVGFEVKTKSGWRPIRR